MHSILIAYSTTDGHTSTICTRIRKVLEESGARVALFEITGNQPCDLDPFDTVVIGASIRYGKYRPDVYDFIATHREKLDRSPSAFFSVNVVARKAGKNTAQTNPYVRAFASKTTWVPKLVEVFAGKIDYPSYTYLDRQVIRFIMWLTHGPTDPKSCTDFTDWDNVDNFARKIAKLGDSANAPAISAADGEGRRQPSEEAAP
jgi:menaquinone-dependent protoporphyrinogen oxidase